MRCIIKGRAIVVKNSPARPTETLAVVQEYGDTVPRTGTLEHLEQADEMYSAYLDHLCWWLGEARIQRAKAARLLRESLVNISGVLSALEGQLGNWKVGLATKRSEIDVAGALRLDEAVSNLPSYMHRQAQRAMGGS